MTFCTHKKNHHSESTEMQYGMLTHAYLVLGASLLHSHFTIGFVPWCLGNDCIRNRQHISLGHSFPANTERFHIFSDLSELLV